jgi:hypothetical protein
LNRRRSLPTRSAPAVHDRLSDSGVTLALHAKTGKRKDKNKEIQMAKFSDFEMASITGDPIKLSQFEDQVCLVVNVATN